MDLDEIKNLMQLLENTDITELQVEKKDSKIKIKREKFYAPPEARHGAGHFSDREVKPSIEAPGEGQNFATISSPIVGIFHRAPSPESAPFVEVGSPVKKGQVLCIVEAMKLMNEIESDSNGTVVRILIENGHPVEYGEPLFLIDPSP